jgi:prepilin-type N-terminal cleavage/methylation domain-containing protein
MTGARPRDRGETLIELLVAVTIMGIAVVALLGALGTSIRMSDIHRKQTVAGANVHAFADAVATAVAGSPSAYVPCAGAAAYQSVYTADTNFTATVVSVRYWDGTAFTTSCTVPTDSGVQLVSLQVSSADVEVSAVERLDIIIRKPCRPLDPACT